MSNSGTSGQGRFPVSTAPAYPANPFPKSPSPQQYQQQYHSYINGVITSPHNEPAYLPQQQHQQHQHPESHLQPYSYNHPHYQHQHASTGLAVPIYSASPLTDHISSQSTAGHVQAPPGEYAQSIFPAPPIYHGSASRRGSLAMSEPYSSGTQSEGEISGTVMALESDGSGVFGIEPTPQGGAFRSYSMPTERKSLIGTRALRSGSACTNCRKSKMKCDGQLPCGRCATGGHDTCRYERPIPSTTPRVKKGTMSYSAVDSRIAAFESRLQQLEQAQSKSVPFKSVDQDRLEQRVRELEEQVVMLTEALRARGGLLPVQPQFSTPNGRGTPNRSAV